MTESEARALIEDETQWQASPALSVEEVDRLLARARVADADGIEPGEDGYVDTWTAASVDASIAAGWRMKLAKVAGAYDVKAGDVEAKRSQAATSLAARASAYGRGSGGGIGTIVLTTAMAEDEG